ncbi:stonustoxin subunit beta-like [Dicentrarchus labrax]|uniref:B30.2/SPRY domain-containing protein n=1 Tax=Dicentrarchus labrax TaxID=13489 RepID=A0A8C4HJ61_DICLA|nr:stonustoxin subunit beta-like [Dicentrarchus labrax]XP_051272950.1 stonustoxin subunit beta-like [Dicentrarchus labrax]XP_051272951.1 stonustoxin subunit beta-like [Dicentrarchus labrax]
MASDNMKIAALGRPFTLGMLYDARRDQLIPGVTLWDKETHKVTSQEGSTFHISASDTIESKSSLLDINASLKASFMGGLIEVGGSAEYLNDTKKYKNQSRVTFQYNATTTFKQLSVTHLECKDPQQIDIIKKSSATHVVTGILYGANAFFVFDSQKLDVSSVQNIEGSMEAVIKKIPSFNIEGNVDIKLTDEEKELTNKFSCKFYGDFILDSNPATFEQAVKTYAELPKLLGEEREKAVPLKVWLMPLKNLHSEADELKSGISVGLVRKAQDALEDFREIRMRYNECLDDSVVENLPQIKGGLDRFRNLCEDYESSLKKTMAKKFSLIREGTEDESLTKQLFEDRDKSPFSKEKLKSWLDHKEKEINIIRSCVERMQETKIVPNQLKLDKDVRAPGVEDALCFVFTSLESADPWLDAMAGYLKSPKLGSNEDHWCYSDEVFTKMRKKAKDFHYLAKALKNNSRFCFLVAAIENKKYRGATIYHYRDGILISEDFSKPDLPPVETITDKRDLIWYACDVNLDPNTANYNLTLSEGNKKATSGPSQTYPDHPERFDKHTQVLGKERLKGRHYWEVEWSNGCPESLHIGVAYKGIDRKSGAAESILGKNAMSWSLHQYSDDYYYNNKHTLEPWHNGKLWEVSFPSGCNRIGLFLDWPAGTLSYYNVSSHTLTHLHTFEARFNEPVYPGFYAYNNGNYVYVCPIE